MKTLRLFPLLSALALGALLAAVPVSRAADPDYSLIQKLPERETAAKKTAHQGWDTGNTPKMLEATSAYNDALTGMITDLAAAYYGKAKITREDVAAYVKTLKAAAEFRHKLDNPNNEDRGTEDRLEAPATVSNDLEETVAQMVAAVTEDDEKFDYPGWEKKWGVAVKTGDIEPTPAAAPLAPVAPPAKSGKTD